MGSGTSLEFCDRTDIGRRRANNQDAKAVLEPWSREQYRRRGWLFVVADGMGAHAAGEMASALAAEHVPLLYEKLANRSPPHALRASLEQTNAEIHSRGETSPDLKGMGTTCTALVVVPRGALVAHVGDSRAYRVRGTTIEQLTQDHSLAWELAAQAGGADGLAIAPPKNIITRSMGPHAKVEVDIEGPFPVEQDDVFVLCSDGLSGQVADEEIGLLASGLPPREAASALVGLALVRGAPDNVTVIVARAGEKEVSRTAAGDEPWPREYEEPASRQPRPLPWRLLALAGGCLFMAIVALPHSFVMHETGPIGGLFPDPVLRDAVAVVSCGAFLLGCVVATLVAYFSFAGSSTSDRRPLRMGDLFGEGPYRRYDCAATGERIEGIVASVESAADALEPAAAAACLAPVRRTRDELARGRLTAALAATGEALAAFTGIVEAARPGGSR